MEMVQMFENIQLGEEQTQLLFDNLSRLPQNLENGSCIYIAVRSSLMNPVSCTFDITQVAAIAAWLISSWDDSMAAVGKGVVAFREMMKSAWQAIIEAWRRVSGYICKAVDGAVDVLKSFWDWITSVCSSTIRFLCRVSLTMFCLANSQLPSIMMKACGLLTN